MRDECTTIPTFDTDFLPGRPHDWDCFFHRSCALEVRRIRRDLGHEPHQTLDLFWSCCWHALERVRILNIEILTIRELADLDYSWTHTNKENTILLVLRIELGHDDVHGCLGSSVQSTCLDVEVVNQVEVGMATGDSNDLFDVALQDKWEEKIEKVDVSNHIRPE